MIINIRHHSILTLKKVTKKFIQKSKRLTHVLIIKQRQEEKNGRVRDSSVWNPHAPSPLPSLTSDYPPLRSELSLPLFLSPVRQRMIFMTIVHRTEKIAITSHSVRRLYHATINPYHLIWSYQFLLLCNTSGGEKRRTRYTAEEKILERRPQIPLLISVQKWTHWLESKRKIQ